jgi:outer membrane protein assembly factor BamB
VATLGGVKQVIVQTEKNVVSVSVADGKLLWQEKSAGGRYAASSPVLDEANSVMFGTRGNGSYAIKISKDGDTFKTEQLWNNTTMGAEYVTPVLKNGFLYGINPQNTYYCLNAKTGATAWPAPAAGGATPAAPAGGPGRRGGMGGGMGAAGGNVMGAVAGGGMGGGMGGGRGMGMGRGMMGGTGYGSVVDAGSVLFGLTSNGKLVVYEPSYKEYKELATYQVANGQVYAYPIISGKRIFTADQTTVTLWTLE